MKAFADNEDDTVLSCQGFNKEDVMQGAMNTYGPVNDGSGKCICAPIARQGVLRYSDPAFFVNDDFNSFVSNLTQKLINLFF